MKLLLHIGSYKTASTSMQYFFALNRRRLRSQGYLYPKARNNVHVANELVTQLVSGRPSEVAQFLDECQSRADQNDCHTVVISAEYFFNMTSFQVDIKQGQRLSPDYWENESLLIDKLKDCCRNFDNVNVACYMKSQGDLAASLYNQFVKNVFGISDTFEQYCERILPAFDYKRLVETWEAAFGIDNVFVRNFHTCKADPINDFCLAFMSAKCLEDARQQTLHVNERLSRDVLEYKRAYNRMPIDRSAAIVARRCFSNISKLHPDKDGYQVYAEDAFNDAFFGPYAPDNDALSKRFGIAEILTHCNDSVTYPGLSTKTHNEINEQLYDATRHPRNNFEIKLRQLLGEAIDAVPGHRALTRSAQRIISQIELWSATR